MRADEDFLLVRQQRDDDQKHAISLLAASRALEGHPGIWSSVATSDGTALSKGGLRMFVPAPTPLDDGTGHVLDVGTRVLGDQWLTIVVSGPDIDCHALFASAAALPFAGTAEIAETLIGGSVAWTRAKPDMTSSEAGNACRDVPYGTSRTFEMRVSGTSSNG